MPSADLPFPDSTAVDRFLADPQATVARLAAAATAADSAREAAWLLAETAGPALGLDDCVVYLREDSHPLLVQRAAWGCKQVSRRIIEHPIELAFGQGIVGCAANLGLPLFVPDSRLYPHYLVDDAARLSELAVPIFAGARVVGVFDSEHPAADFYRGAHLRAITLLVDAVRPLLART